MEASSRRRRLALEITAALVVKFAALVVIWNVWFAESASLRVDGNAVAQSIYASPTAAKSTRDAP